MMNDLEKVTSPESKEEQLSLSESDYFRYSNASCVNHMMFNLPILNKSKYEFIKQIGHGSSSKVYRVVLNETGKVYAIKVFEKRLLLYINKLNSVLIEYEILKKLEHPFIIKTHGLYEDEEKLYLVVDICNNKDLGNFITNNYPLKTSVIKYLSLNIYKALEYLAENKLIHRDLKPSNFLLDDYYNVILVIEY
jgi:serine/threonine protein kinase